MHLNSKLLFEKYAVPFFRVNHRVLEISPDAIPSSFRECVRETGIQWETLELRRADRPTPAPGVSHIAEREYSFPIPENTYDVVLSGQVIEHVRKIWVWVRELARICRPGGVVITICPVSWPYHEDPVDCWRIYPEGMRALCEEAGLQPVVIECQNLEPPVKLREKRWFLAKQAAKGLIGLEPFLAPFAQAWAPTLDTIAIARKL
jgi:SAM-dependent methyltransferase